MKKLAHFLLAVSLLFSQAANAQQQPFPYIVGDKHLLFVLKSANFNSTSDQALSVYSSMAPKYLITDIYVTNCSTSMTTAQGGIYTGASKSGTTIVASSQAYTSLTSAAVLLSLTLNTTTTPVSGLNLYLSLTSAQGSAATCDVYVYGADLP